MAEDEGGHEAEAFAENVIMSAISGGIVICGGKLSEEDKTEEEEESYLKMRWRVWGC